MWYASRLKYIVEEMYSQRKKCTVEEGQWELTEKLLFQEICASYERLMKLDH